MKAREKWWVSLKTKGPGRGWWKPPKGTHVGGSSRGMVGAAYFARSPGYDLVSKLDEKTRKLVVEVLVNSAFIRESHLTGIDHMTVEPNPNVGEWGRETGYVGVYDRLTKTIHLDPDGNLPISLVVTHEIGHHFYETLASKSVKERIYKQADVLADKYAAVTFAKSQPIKDSWLAKRGLRTYSVSGIGWQSELPADIFSMLNWGSKDQISALADSMDVSTNELRRLFTEG